MKKNKIKMEKHVSEEVNMVKNSIIILIVVALFIVGFFFLTDRVVKNRQVELTGCLVTSTGDINFVFYDNANKNFYRITNIVVKDKNNNYRPVNCYGLNQAEQLDSNNIRR